MVSSDKCEVRRGKRSERVRVRVCVCVCVRSRARVCVYEGETVKIEDGC